MVDNSTPGSLGKLFSNKNALQRKYISIIIEGET